VAITTYVTDSDGWLPFNDNTGGNYRWYAKLANSSARPQSVRMGVSGGTNKEGFVWNCPFIAEGFTRIPNSSSFALINPALTTVTNNFGGDIAYENVVHYSANEVLIGEGKTAGLANQELYNVNGIVVRSPSTNFVGFIGFNPIRPPRRLAEIRSSSILFADASIGYNDFYARAVINDTLNGNYGQTPPNATDDPYRSPRLAPWPVNRRTYDPAVPGGGNIKRHGGYFSALYSDGRVDRVTTLIRPPGAPDPFQ
jgi:hypothetical protein